MRKILTLTMSGLVTVLPLALTVYVIWWLVNTVEGWLRRALIALGIVSPEHYWPCLGLIAGFVLLVVTGSMLFLAIPVRTYHSIWFRLKILMIIIAAVNIAVFTFKVERDKAAWDLGPVPRNSKICALVSLGAWCCVIVFGRLIAYNWFDCDSISSAAMAQITGCPLDPG